MVYCVSDGCGRPDRANFANAFNAEWIHVWIVFLHKERLDLWDIGIYRNMILAKVSIYDAAHMLIEHSMFHERHADTPDDATYELAAGSLGIEDAARSKRAHVACHTYLSRIGMHMHLGKVCTKGTGSVFLQLWIRLDILHDLHNIHGMTAENICVALRLARIILQETAPVFNCHLLHLLLVERRRSIGHGDRQYFAP